MKPATAALCCGLLALQSGPAAGIGQGTASPVEKVVQLLEGLKARIEQDGKSEQQAYDRYACWCEETSERKAVAITGAREELRSLGQAILRLKGKVATRMADIAELGADIKDNEAAQEEATSIRQRENAAYAAETTEMKEVLAALEKAIAVLSQGSGPSFLQRGRASGDAVLAVLEALPSTVAQRPKQLALLREFARGGGSARYAPQSGTIQGILGDMYATFSADLEGAAETEGGKNRDFEALMAEKAEQLSLLKEEAAEKQKEKAEAETMLAESTQSYDDTEAQMKADVAFFDETKEACESKQEAWATRKELRTEELEGISKALEVLSSDEARELFASAIKPGRETGVDQSYETGVDAASLLQLSAGDSGAAPAARAYSALRTSATRAQSLRLAALAARLRTAKAGHFDEVIEAIDKVLGELKKEAAEDAEKRDQCLKEYQKTKSSVAEIGWLIEKNEAAIDKLQGLIEDLGKEEESTAQAIKDLEKDMQDMKDERKDEHAAFESAKEEDQKAMKLLLEAKKFLSSYYSDGSSSSSPEKGLFLSQRAPDFEASPDQAPELRFSDRGARKNEAKGVIQLLTMLIEDLSDEIKSGMQAEEKAQLSFEKQLAAAEALEEELKAKRNDLQKAIADREKEKEDEEGDLEDNKGDLKDEKDYLKEITPDCDWIIGAFKRRAARRTAEADGLRTAKELLSGSAPAGAALLQGLHGRAFDDGALRRIRFLGLR